VKRKTLNVRRKTNIIKLFRGLLPSRKGALFYDRPDQIPVVCPLFSRKDINPQISWNTLFDCPIISSALFMYPRSSASRVWVSISQREPLAM